MYEQSPSFFQGLSAEELMEVLAPLERRRFPAGATVLAEGDAPRDIYVIQSGSADVFMLDRSGVEQRINRVGPGDTLGEMSVFTGRPASATVRATSDLAVLVLTETDFHRIAGAFPRIYHNLGAIVSQRLIQSDHRSFRDKQGSLTALVDYGAPPLLSYALACSVAWHTRASIALLVVVDGDPPADLAALTATTVGTWSVGRPGDGVLMVDTPVATRGQARLMVASPAASFTADTLARTIDRLRAGYDHVLVQVQPGLSCPVPPARTVRLAGLGDALPGPVIGRPGHTIRAWTGTATAMRPDREGVVWVPVLGPTDEQAFQNGVLPASTPAGRALGWAARDLAGLKVGLALGGGAARGYAHLGVLRVLERTALPIDYLAGTSIGAAVATMYALGYSVDRATQMMDRVQQYAVRPTLPIASLLSAARVRVLLQQIGGQARFEDLDLPLAIVAVDLVSRREIVFRRGLLEPAVLASMALPGVYPPQRIGPYTLVDGAILNPVPSDIAAEMGADLVIAVRLGGRPVARAVEAEARAGSGRLPSILKTIMESLELMQTKMGYQTAAAATIAIEPTFAEVGSVGLHQFSEGRRYIPLGEAAAEAALPRISAVLPWLQPG